MRKRISASAIKSAAVLLHVVSLESNGSGATRSWRQVVARSKEDGRSQTVRGLWGRCIRQAFREAARFSSLLLKGMQGQVGGSQFGNDLVRMVPQTDQRESFSFKDSKVLLDELSIRRNAHQYLRPHAQRTEIAGSQRLHLCLGAGAPQVLSRLGVRA